MKQTAVEWLEEMIAKMEAYGGDLPPLMIHISQAKEIEKQQGYSEEDMNDYVNYRLLFKKPIEPKEWFEEFKKEKGL
jgi:hypothetical protein